jgi:hypothetical protein
VPPEERLLVLVDADALAGWRRPEPSLEQLWQAVADLRSQLPDAALAVIADATLKWDLPPLEQEQIEDDVVARRLLYPPAGTIGGQLGFLRKVAERAAAQGMRPILVTDQRVPGVPLCRIHRRGDRFAFDVNKAEIHEGEIKPTRRRRRRVT